jgi:hypothetical protein
MASQINPSNIDATYPIAGQDNDTQGFRTNYINIKNNFATAAKEITDIQSNVITINSTISGMGNIIANVGSLQSSVTSMQTIVTDLIAGAPLALDTLLEIDQSLANNVSLSSTLTNLITGVQANVTAANAAIATGSYLPTYTGNIGANTITLSSAIQFANLTTAQVNAINPSRGMTVYNYTTGNIQVYNGTKWANVTLS